MQEEKASHSIQKTMLKDSRQDEKHKGLKTGFKDQLNVQAG